MAYKRHGTAIVSSTAALKSVKANGESIKTKIKVARYMPKSNSAPIKANIRFIEFSFLWINDRTF